MNAYPLTFTPVYKEKIWGGRKLETVFGRKLPSGKIGESWDVACHHFGMSYVAQGPLQGLSLEEVYARWPKEMLGGLCEQGRERFPLLMKIIDAADTLSIQVHPDDVYAAKHEQNESGKTEIWYVLAAEPGASIVYGLKPGIDRKEFAAAIEDNDLERCLNFVPVANGDAFFIPAGLIHALGKGVMVAEVQQNSDATYRVYDWGRVGDDGQPRALHIDKALDVIDFSDHSFPGVTELEPPFSSPFFVLGRHAAANDTVVKLDTFHILLCLQEKIAVETESGVLSLEAGDSCLIPAVCGWYKVAGPGKYLRAHLPVA